MKPMPPDLPVSEEDWNQTPAAVQALLLTLWQQVAELQAEVAQLREQVGRNSQNSSQPPSSDPPNAPPHVPAGRFGPRVQATVGYLTGRIGISQRDVDEVMTTVFHTDLSLGSIPAQEERVSAALAEPGHDGASP